MLVRSVYQNALVLSAFALLCVGLIAVFHLLTKEKIQAEMEAKLARTLNELVEHERYNNDVHHDCTKIVSEGLLGLETTRVYRMRKDDKPVAIAFPVIAPNGYNGKIELIIGVNYDLTLAGVRTIQHNETPGLGDKIEKNKSPWIEQFENLSLMNTPEGSWKVKKDGGSFDAFTGATITPRAVLGAIEKALLFAQQQNDKLYTGPNNCGDER